MQLLQTQPDGRHLCLLNDEELTLLLQADAGRTWRDGFLRDLYALPLDEATANAVARAVEHQPQLFQDGQGRPMSFEAWAQAVHAGGWSAPGVGPARLRKLAEALEQATDQPRNLPGG